MQEKISCNSRSKISTYLLKKRIRFEQLPVGVVLDASGERTTMALEAMHHLVNKIVLGNVIAITSPCDHTTIFDCVKSPSNNLIKCHNFAHFIIIIIIIIIIQFAKRQNVKRLLWR